MTRLLLSDKQVKLKLLDRVNQARHPLVVTMVREGDRPQPLENREPFASLERVLGAGVELVVVVDEGTPEGMWRDPVGDLAELLYPEDRSMQGLAAQAYFLVEARRPLGVVRRQASTREDVDLILKALRQRPNPTSPRGPPTRAASFGQEDPYVTLGVPDGAPLEEVRKAFRQLMAQYHPDKVAHLAPEFQTLAEKRTRQISAAWEKINAGK